MADTDVTFEPISRETVSSQIRAQLMRRITTGDLAPGQQMPSERDLADQFRVARTSVREAMQGLLSLGVVERRGNRSFVAEHLPEVTVDVPDDRKGFVTQLFETRRVLEVPIFRLAAERATDEERVAVAELAAKFHDDLDIASFRALDREFHTTIAAACGKHPIVVKDNPMAWGYVANRIYASMLREAGTVVSEGIASHEEVNQLMVDCFGWPVGPFAMVKGATSGWDE